jgi:hypothetical protein
MTARRNAAAALAAVAPAPASSHDAFGDLGPFYASLLHPLADPLQAALLVGAAAFLASGPVSLARVALPVFAGAATLAVFALAAGAPVAAAPALAAVAALGIGLAAMLPAAWVPLPAALALVALAGALIGLSPGATAAASLPHALGTVVGVAALAALAWFGLETAGRRVTPLVPRVVGSWVAAVGILVAAFAA